MSKEDFWSGDEEEKSALLHKIDELTVEVELYKNAAALAAQHLKTEQAAGRKICERLCKAMGTWTGPWEDAAVARLKAGSK